MKKLLVAIMLLVGLSSYGQELVKFNDEMDNKTTWLLEGSPLYLDGDRGFRLIPYFDRDGSVNEHGVPQITEMIVKSAGLGCVEDLTIIILFKDGSRVVEKSWNKFNCNGTSYISLSKDVVNQLQAKEINKVRITNGRNYKSVTVDAPEPTFFLEAKRLIDNGIYTEK